MEWETSQPPPSRRVHQVPSLLPPLHLPTLSNWPPVPRLRLRPSGLPARYCLLTIEPSQLVLQPRPTFNPWKEKQTSEQPHFHEYKSANPSPPTSLVTQRPFSSPASSEHEQGRQHFSPPPKSVSQEEMEDEGSQHRSRLSKTWGSDGYEDSLELHHAHLWVPLHSQKPPSHPLTQVFHHNHKATDQGTVPCLSLFLQLATKSKYFVQ